MKHSEALESFRDRPSQFAPSLSSVVAPSSTQLPPCRIADEDLGVEILIHNVSHSDLVVSLNNVEGSIKDAVIARPKFNRFQSITRGIFDQFRAGVTRYEPVKVRLENKPENEREVG